MINHHWKAEIISKLTVHSQLLFNNFSLANDEVRAGCPELVNTILMALFPAGVSMGWGCFISSVMFNKVVCPKFGHPALTSEF